MSDIMRPMSIGHLMNWALSEYKKKGSIFGIDKLVPVSYTHLTLPTIA